MNENYNNDTRGLRGYCGLFAHHHENFRRQVFMVFWVILPCFAKNVEKLIFFPLERCG
jgi:hypothetical protein